jgi:hypothetical protein
VICKLKDGCACNLIKLTCTWMCDNPLLQYPLSSLFVMIFMIKSIHSMLSCPLHHDEHNRSQPVLDSKAGVLGYMAGHKACGTAQHSARIKHLSSHCPTECPNCNTYSMQPISAGSQPRCRCCPSSPTAPQPGVQQSWQPAPTNLPQHSAAARWSAGGTSRPPCAAAGPVGPPALNPQTLGLLLCLQGTGRCQGGCC